MHVSSEIKICELDTDILRDQDVRRLQVVVRNLSLEFTNQQPSAELREYNEVHHASERTSLCRYDSDVRSWNRMLRADSSSKCPCICMTREASRFSSLYYSCA